MIVLLCASLESYWSMAQSELELAEPWAANEWLGAT